MLTHFILALSLLATFIECRPESEYLNKPDPVYTVDYSGEEVNSTAKKLHTLEVWIREGTFFQFARWKNGNLGGRWKKAKKGKTFKEE